MNLLKRLRTDLNAAVKSRDATKVSVLRMLLADLHNRKIAARAELNEEQVVAALRTAVKQRQEAAEQFAAGGREDRAAAERAEIEVIEAYLPSLLEGEELQEAVDSVIDKTGASSPADMGKVMGALMSEYQGRIDGKAANALVRERLGAH
ncbi:MAG TPA: GatB/YqeY domain-containing protein [Acidobacteriota bacterium]